MNDAQEKLLVYLGGGALLAYLLWPKKSSAAEKARLEPAKAPQAGSPEGGTGGTFKDETTGVLLEGPSTSLAPTPKYTIQKGESWSNIASRVYGDFRLWPFLWDWNRMKYPSKYQNPDALNVGDEIEIPATVPVSPDYRAALQRRADLHRQYWLCVRKSGVTKCATMGVEVLTATPMPQ